VRELLLPPKAEERRPGERRFLSLVWTIEEFKMFPWRVVRERELVALRVDPRFFMSPKLEVRKRLLLEITLLEFPLIISPVSEVRERLPLDWIRELDRFFMSFRVVMERLFWAEIWAVSPFDRLRVTPLSSLPPTRSP